MCLNQFHQTQLITVCERSIPAVLVPDVCPRSTAPFPSQALACNPQILTAKQLIIKDSMSMKAKTLRTSTSDMMQNDQNQEQREQTVLVLSIRGW